jgi:hypothetical protein
MWKRDYFILGVALQEDRQIWNMAQQMQGASAHAASREGLV